MRMLSWLWDWCALDPMKQANLQLPDHTVRHTFMGYVPYVPEVALAWHKAVRGVIGSILIASFATIPASIWYVDFSRRRGHSIMEERHERGAMLVDRDLLFKEISQHNEMKFVEEAKDLFPEMCMKLIEKGQTSNQALADNLMTADLKQVHRHLQKTIADPLTAPEAARMAESIRAVFNTNAQALRFLPDDGKPYSIKQWITGEKKPGSILFITCTYTDLEMNKALLTLWSNLAIHSLMTMPHTRSLRTWFMFDELGALHRLPAIENGLQTARNFGGAMILGLHSFDKLVQVYGEENARNLSSLARTKLMLAAADLDTAEQCARYIGNREIRQMDEGYSYGYNSTRDASTLTPRKQIEPLVIPDDIMNLPSMHGFVKFPDGFPAARIQLEWQHYAKVAEGFMRRPPSKPDDPDGNVRGGGGKPKGGDDGGRGENIALSEEEVAARDNPIALASNILSQPSEQEREEQEGRDPKPMTSSTARARLTVERPSPVASTRWS